MHYNPFTLFFTKEWAFLEPRFRQFYFKENLSRMRFALYLATFMYAVFGVLDAVIAPEQKVVFWIIRYAFVIPGTLIVIAWSFRPGFQKVSMPVLTVLGILGGLGIEIMIALAEPPAVYSYYAGIILVFITVHVLFGMHLVWAGICSITIVLCYEIIAIWGVDTPVPIIVNNNFFFHFQLYYM